MNLIEALKYAAETGGVIVSNVSKAYFAEEFAPINVLAPHVVVAHNPGTTREELRGDWWCL
jgi:hypothetical protein